MTRDTREAWRAVGQFSMGIAALVGAVSLLIGGFPAVLWLAHFAK